MKWIRLCEFGMLTLGAIGCTSHESPGPVDARNQEASNQNGAAHDMPGVGQDAALPGQSQGTDSSANQGSHHGSTSVDVGAGTSEPKGGGESMSQSQGAGQGQPKGPSQSAGPGASPASSSIPSAPMSDADVKTRLDRVDARIVESTTKLVKAKPESRTRATELLKKVKEERAAIEKNRTTPVKKPGPVDAVDMNASISTLERDLDELETTLKP